MGFSVKNHTILTIITNMALKTIRVYNTASRTIEEFVPIHEEKVSMYSCGPTVYHYPHLGNIRGYVITDTVRRMFLYAGYKVDAVINITDVGHNVDDDDSAEDKMEKGSAREGKSAWEIAEFYTQAYFTDLDAVNIPRNQYSFPRATETIQEQIALVKALEEKGYTYQTSDGIYFDTAKFSEYPNLAKLDIEGLQSGARVEDKGEKKRITDFALWKFSPKDEKRQMEWKSPWGIGFPGWHIECSAMSKKILGPHFDVHMGGIDHIPVHHTNEIAQSVCANGEPYVNYWLHYNFLNDQSGKMAKSNGDFLRLQSVIDKSISPLAYRYYLLTAHYRSEIAFSFESLEAAATSYEKLVAYVREHKSGNGKINEHYSSLFDDVLFEDVGTPGVIATIWKMMKDDSVSSEDKVATILRIDQVLGLDLLNQSQKDVSVVLSDEVQTLLDERIIAKEKKDFIKSDVLRKKIQDLGYEVKDTIAGQQIFKK